MDEIHYIDRLSGKTEIEKVYGGTALRFLYGDSWVSHFFGLPLTQVLARYPFWSAIYGYCQKTKWSACKIKPFIEEYHIDVQEFEKKPEDFESFNDFFIRKLKPSARPITQGTNTAIIPADGRYRFFPNIKKNDGFYVKGKKFDLAELLGNEQTAQKYYEGSMIIARLCPTDYHRFHFPCDCVPSRSRLINGYLYSVNPIALKKNINIFTENKRSISSLTNTKFGEIQYIEVGATSVGTICKTYTPFQSYSKGDEKGYFSFGGSALILLFEPNCIKFSDDLLRLSAQELEIKCLMGQSLGTTLHS